MRSKEVEEAIQEIQTAIEYDKKHRIVTVFDKTPLFRDVLQTALDYILELENKLEGKDCVIETLMHNEEINEEIIKALEEELKPIKELNIPVETLVAEHIRLEDLEDRIETQKYLANKNGENFEFKNVKK